MLSKLTICLAAGFILITQDVRASLILDSAVESANGWTTSSSFVNGLGSLSPTEGTEFSTLPVNITTITSPSLGGNLAEGTYTLQFAVGSDTASLVLAFGFGLSGLGPANQSTPSPTPGTWELWSARYVVPNGDPRIGNPLLFTADFFTVGGDGGFDGVGSLSPDGNGFLVDFVPAAVPEASEALVMLCGMTGLLLGTRRRSRS